MRPQAALGQHRRRAEDMPSNICYSFEERQKVNREASHCTCLGRGVWKLAGAAVGVMLSLSLIAGRASHLPPSFLSFLRIVTCAMRPSPWLTASYRWPDYYVSDDRQR